MGTANLERLADLAISANYGELSGTEAEAINAENAFFDAFFEQHPEHDTQEFQLWMLKATPFERIHEAMRRIGVDIGSL